MGKIKRKVTVSKKMSEEAALPRDFDIFYHYDTQSPALEDGVMAIKVPKEGFYYVALSNVYLDYQAVQPPVGTSFLAIEKMDNINNGSCVTGNPKQSNKILFPLSDASSATPDSKTYHRVLFSTEDNVKFSVYDITFTKYVVARIAATIHIASKPDIIRDSL